MNNKLTQPALHRQYIKNGLMTESESQKMIEDAEYIQKIETEARKAIIEKAEAEDRIVNQQKDE